MPLSRKKREQLLTMCGQLNEDDAVDPREYFRKKYRAKDSQAQRLCKQVAETLSLVLSGEFADEILQSLDVFCVQPAPNTRRLLVVVQPKHEIRETITPELILTKLDCVSVYLRSEVAAAISRRKAPSLIFEIIWPNSDPANINCSE